MNATMVGFIMVLQEFCVDFVFSPHIWHTDLLIWIKRDYK